MNFSNSDGEGEKTVPLAQSREIYHFYRRARLSREELAELIEIGLDLKEAFR